MKNFTLFFALLFLTAVANAQHKSRIALKGGLNIASQHLENVFGEKSATLSFHLASTLELPLSKRFLIQSGLSVQGKGVKVDIGSYQDGIDHGNVSLTYLEVPVNAIASFEINNSGRLFVGAGPYLAFGIDGNRGIGNVRYKRIFKSIPGANGYKRTDYGLNFLAGAELKSHIILNIQYGLGLFDFAPELYIAPAIDYPAGFKPVKESYKNRVASISAGYMF